MEKNKIILLHILIYFCLLILPFTPSRAQLPNTLGVKGNYKELSFQQYDTLVKKDLIKDGNYYIYSTDRDNLKYLLIVSFKNKKKEGQSLFFEYKKNRSFLSLLRVENFKQGIYDGYFYQNIAYSFLEGYYKEGEKCGAWIEASSSDDLSYHETYKEEKGSYKRGKKNGKWITFTFSAPRNQKDSTIAHYKKGVLHGSWKQTAVSSLDSVIIMGTFKKGKKEGVWETKDFNAIMESIITQEYHKGNKDGLFTKIEKGVYLIKEKGYYKDNKKHGVWIEKREETICTITTTTHYENGLKEGLYREDFAEIILLHPDFEPLYPISIEGYYRNDKKEGVWIEKRESENIEYVYRDGILIK